MQQPRPAEAGDGGSREVDSPERLSFLLARTRRLAIGVSGATTACLLLATALLLGLAASLIAGLAYSDDLATAPAWARAILLFLLAGGAGLLAWQFFLRPIGDVASDGGVAAFLESRLPGSVGLASAVQFQEELAAHPEAKESPTYSKELARAHISRMAGLSRRIDPSPAVPRGLLKRAGLILLGAALLHSMALLALPGTISRGYGALLAGDGRIPGLDGDGVLSVPDLITGDVELVYHYPDYTGLPPRTVSGTGGDIRALRGTEVELRTRADRDVGGAAMLVGEEVVPLSVSGRRDLHGRLLVMEPGHYRFRFLDSRGRATAEGPAHRITVEPDEYPQIEVSVPGHEGADEIEIREQERLTLDYRARDDYGLEEISIAWRIGGGQEQRALVRRGGRDRIEGRWSWDLTTLRLAPGDRVAWHLEALDNDTVSGPKRSTTRTYYLKVFSAAEHHRALMAKVEQHWEGMIDRLADHLEAPFDPPEGRLESPKVQDAAVAGRLAEEMNRLNDAVAETVAKLREDPYSPVALVDALDNIHSGLVTANRRFESALRLFDSRTRSHRHVERPQVLRVRAGQDRIVGELENGILYLETLLDKQRLQDIISMAEEIREHQRRLADLVESLRENPDEETRAAISEEIARIKERIHELMERMSELARGIRDEHLNLEAMEQLREQDDLLTSLDDIQRMLEEGDLDDALARLLDMANQLESMIDEWRDQDQQFGGEQYAELQRELMEFVDELQRVKRDQDNMLEESEALRDRYREALEERLDGRLDSLIDRITRLAREGREALAEIPEETLDHGFGRLEREAVETAASRLEEVGRLVEARDFDEARQMAEQALHHADRAASSFAEQASSARRHQHFMRRGAEELEEASRHAGRARGRAESIVGALERLFPEPGEVFDDQEMRRMQEMAGQQCQLRGRSRELGRRMQAINEEAPLFSPDMERSLQAASQHMSEAKSQLERSDARQASGQQRAAADRLAELQQQMEEAAQRGGQGTGVPMPLAGRADGRSGPSSGRFSHERVEIPDADQYEAPEQFRRELLEAMREGTPRRYQEQVRRYYEELVR